MKCFKVMKMDKRYIVTFEAVIEAEDLYEAVRKGYELEKKYKDIELHGVRLE